MKRRISIGLIVAVLLSMALFSIASGHAKLVSSNPAAGAKLDQAPTKVTLVFSEEISAKPIRAQQMKATERVRRSGRNESRREHVSYRQRVGDREPWHEHHRRDERDEHHARDAREASHDETGGCGGGLRVTPRIDQR